MNNLIGKRVLIIGNHTWSGEIGTVEEFKDTAIGKAGYIVALDNGTSCFVFNTSNLQILRN